MSYGMDQNSFGFLLNLFPAIFQGLENWYSYIESWISVDEQLKNKKDYKIKTTGEFGE